jgi:hypothetical protein
MSSKTINFYALTSAKDAPAVGKYNQVSMTGNGKYFVSKFRDSGCRFFAPSTLQRFPPRRADEPPGPAAYHSEIVYDDKGRSFISKFKNIPGGVIAQAHRPEHFVNKDILQVPGPATYQQYCEFVP